VKWTDIPVHVVDFEGSARTGVVEFGVVTLVAGAIAAMHTRVCRPASAIPAAESRIHGLGESDVVAAAAFIEEWPLFAGLRESGVLAAHFSATENALLRAAWACPRLSPDFLSPGRTLAEWGPWIDTGRLAIGAFPAGEGAGLEVVVRTLGLEASLAAMADQWCPAARRRYHCAPFDALAGALVLHALAREESGEAWSLARVLTGSTGDAQRREERSQARWF
jgi:DNA polymerase III epsilon subunit-like protein